MGISVFLTMAGGLALFLYGMELMGEGLSGLSGGRLQRRLERMTDSPLKALSLGMTVTAVVQSSSAVTVMAVSLVDSGMIRLQQAVEVIMGANIGTTVTSWLFSFEPMALSMIVVIVGVGMLLSHRESLKNAANILVGFSVLLFGMDTMRNAVLPLTNVPEFTGLLIRFSNPFLGLAAGMAFTALIQSSSASVGVLQSLCLTGAVSYQGAVPVILGQNIGTCATAMLSCAGASLNAKRTALVHLYFNVIGAILFMTMFYAVNAVKPLPFLQEPATPLGIAAIHSLFNIASTLCLLPFSRQLVKLSCMTLREKEGCGSTEIRRILH